MKKRFRDLAILLSFVLCAHLATHVHVEQHHSGGAGLAFFFTFILGLTSIYGNMGLRNQRRTLAARRHKILPVLNFVCLLMIFGAAGWVLGGLWQFSNTNFVAFSVLLYFLGIRLGAYLHFHV